MPDDMLNSAHDLNPLGLVGRSQTIDTQNHVRLVESKKDFTFSRKDIMERTQKTVFTLAADLYSESTIDEEK